MKTVLYPVVGPLTDIQKQQVMILREKGWTVKVKGIGCEIDGLKFNGIWIDDVVTLESTTENVAKHKS